jgi:hypothetical protein
VTGHAILGTGAELLDRLVDGDRPDRLELPGSPSLAVQAELARCGYVATREVPGAYVRTVGVPAAPRPRPAVGLAGAIAERVLEDLPGTRVVDPVDVHGVGDLVVVGDSTPTGRWVGRLAGAERSLRRDLVVARRVDGGWRTWRAPARVALDPMARPDPGVGQVGASADVSLRLGLAGLPAPSPAARSWAAQIGRAKAIALGGPQRGHGGGRLVDRVRVAVADLDVVLLHPSAFATAADRAVVVAVSAWAGVLPVTEEPERLAPYLSAEVRQRIPTPTRLPSGVVAVERSLGELGSVLARDHDAQRVQRTLNLALAWRGTQLPPSGSSTSRR